MLNRVDLECFCGKPKGQLNVISNKKSFHVHCLCKDCQKFASILDNEDKILDAHRGQGLGSQLMKHAIEVAKEADCGIFQLTSNKERMEANKFYRELGLSPTHDGYKLYFTDQSGGGK